jgi:sugar phosphate isomerase/epimerase
MLFINLPITWAAREPRYLDLFLDHNRESATALGPELGMDALAMDSLDAEFHASLARRLERTGLQCAVHLPFLDLHPASLDPLALEATRERLRRAWELCALYRPAHMIGHAAHGELHPQYPEQWIARSRETWEALERLWPDHPPLHLENTYERAPEPVAEMVAALDMERVGICFDVGHWFSFAGGSRSLDPRADLERWLDVLGPHLTHLHLHDNDGSFDQHLGLGRGRLPLGRLAAALAVRGLRPGLTLEPHTEAAFHQSLTWLDARPGLFSV